MSAAPYLERSPRYVFQAEDGTLVRFAAMETKGLISRAVIRDLSESGLSFSLPLNLTDLPEEGSVLKVEFPIPGRRTIACFATVTRTEERTEWMPEWGDRGYHLIALQFRHLPQGHLMAIQAGLKGLTKDDQTVNVAKIKQTHAFAFAVLTIALACAMYVMSLPQLMYVR